MWILIILTSTLDTYRRLQLSREVMAIVCHIGWYEVSSSMDELAFKAINEIHVGDVVLKWKWDRRSQEKIMVPNEELLLHNV